MTACQPVASTPPSPALAQALARLFPELPPWAIAPFVRAPFVPILAHPEPDGSRVITLTTGAPYEPPHTSPSDPPSGRQRGRIFLGAWAIDFVPLRIVQEISAAWRYRGHSTSMPFGSYSSTVRLAQPDGPQWVSPRVEHTIALGPLPAAYRLDARDDILRRWRGLGAAADQAVLREFWIGHPTQELAELGMATLRPQVDSYATGRGGTNLSSA